MENHFVSQSISTRNVDNNFSMPPPRAPKLPRHSENVDVYLGTFSPFVQTQPQLPATCNTNQRQKRSTGELAAICGIIATILAMIGTIHYVARLQAEARAQLRLLEQMLASSAELNKRVTRLEENENDSEDDPDKMDDLLNKIILLQLLSKMEFLEDKKADHHGKTLEIAANKAAEAI